MKIVATKWLWAVFLVSTPLLYCQDGRPDLDGIVSQQEYQDSINGCAPASILNCLKFSKPEFLSVYDSLIGATDGVKIRFVVDRYFKSRPSIVYPDRRRWGLHGIQDADLVTGFNELLADHDLPPLKATYLDRGDDETRAAHIRRCHDLMETSVKNGVLPILGIRSYVVRRRERNDDEPMWEIGTFHNVVVHSIVRPPSYTGFEIAVLDSSRGHATTAYLHREGNRQDFSALKGIEENDDWIHGEPYLQIIAPDLPTTRPRNLEWSERIVITATFLIGDF